eukprot:6176614-Pleurochrysis_carterae.AAC.2
MLCSHCEQHADASSSHPRLRNQRFRDQPYATTESKKYLHAARCLLTLRCRACGFMNFVQACPIPRTGWTQAASASSAL